MKPIIKKLSLFLFIALLSFGKLVAKDSITVYLFLLDKCRICQELSPEINAIYELHKYDFAFMGVFPNFISKKEDIDDFNEKYKIKFKTKTDYFKKTSQKLSATVTPEVVVYNENTNQVLYRGAVNDLFYSPGKRRHHISNQYLRNALDDIQSGRPVKTPFTTPIGCIINVNDFIDN